MACKQQLDLKYVFVPACGCWGQNTSRIQNKEVYATLYFQAQRRRLARVYSSALGRPERPVPLSYHARSYYASSTLGRP